MQWIYVYNEGFYMTIKSIFRNVFKLDCELSLEFVPGNNQHYTMITTMVST